MAAVLARPCSQHMFSAVAQPRILTLLLHSRSSPGLVHARCATHEDGILVSSVSFEVADAEEAASRTLSIFPRDIDSTSPGRTECRPEAVLRSHNAFPSSSTLHGGGRLGHSPPSKKGHSKPGRTRSVSGSHAADTVA